MKVPLRRRSRQQVARTQRAPQSLGRRCDVLHRDRAAWTNCTRFAWRVQTRMRGRQADDGASEFDNLKTKLRWVRARMLSGHWCTFLRQADSVHESRSTPTSLCLSLWHSAIVHVALPALLARSNRYSESNAELWPCLVGTDDPPRLMEPMTRNSRK